MVKPERTAIDWIVDADAVVLARPDSDNAFTFDIVDVLYGSNDLPPIDQLVDSSARRKLAANPGHAVLFATSNDGSWQRVAYVDGAFRPILAAALSGKDAWSTGMPQDRIEFIEALQDSSDPRHKDIVIGELDKVPYAQLRAFDLRIPTAELIADLRSRDGYSYQAIRAVLLGLSGTAEARDAVTDVIHRARTNASARNLGAFAAAYIELEGLDGVKALSREFLFDPEQPLDKIEQVVMAMSVHHGLSDAALQTAIDGAIARLVRDRPEAGVQVARQFSLRSNWSQFATLETLAKERKLTTIDEQLTVSLYLARAHSGDRRSFTEPNGG